MFDLSNIYGNQRYDINAGKIGQVIQLSHAKTSGEGFLLLYFTDSMKKAL